MGVELMVLTIEHKQGTSVLGQTYELNKGYLAHARTELALAVRPASKSVIAAKCFLLGVVDKDGDGRLDHKELHGKHFDALDADGDGKLDPHEFLRDVNHVDPDGYGST